MGLIMDRFFIAFDRTVGVMHALSFVHSGGVMWASSGRINAQLARMTPVGAPAPGIDATVTVLERLASLGIVARRENDDDVLRWRLKEGYLTVLNTVPECDVCQMLSQHTPAIADARTKTGVWGYVCAEHFVTEGCNIGTGRGQIIRPTTFVRSALANGS